MSSRVPMTPEGFRRLQAELVRLKSEERPKIVEDIQAAVAQGDLSENSEYEDAKERMNILNHRVGELEDKLARAEVIDPSTLNSEKVCFGAIVQLRDNESEDEVSYQIVGVDEVDIKAGRISLASPIARALMGKKEGDLVRVQVPRGVRELEVVAIKFK